MEKNKSFIPLAVALISLAIGGASLFLSINLLQKLKSSETAISEKSDKAFAAAIESKKAYEEIAVLRKEIDTLKLAIKQNVDTSNKNMKSAFEHYGKSVSENRNLIIANQNAIKALTAKPAAPAPKEEPKPQVSENKAEAKTTETPQAQAASQEYEVYTIKSGDHFSKLARQFNVSIEAIEAANPNVVPTALQIGQKINIPKSK